MSIVKEGYAGAEILISDGGSGDSTLDVINRNEGQIAWWRTGKDNGTWDANNQALQHAKGDFIWIVNSDDRLEPGAIQAFLQALDRNPAGKWFTGKVLALDAKGNSLATFSPQVLTPTCGLSFLTECWIYHPATIVHKDLMIGGFRDTDLLDWDLWIRLEAQGHQPILIDIVLAGLRFHENCKSHDTVGIMEKQVRLLKTIRSEVEALGKTSPLEYDRFLNDMEERVQQQKVRSLAFSGQQKEALWETVHLVNRFPDAISKRWFWGMLKRIFTGFTPQEASPLHFLDSPSPSLT